MLFFCKDSAFGASMFQLFARMRKTQGRFPILKSAFLFHSLTLRLTMV